MKNIYTLIFIIFCQFFANSQCNFSGTPLTQVGTTFSFCIDNTNTITTSSINSGQYIKLNVVKGFSYTFSVANVFSTFNENITVLNASSNVLIAPTAFSSAASGTSLTWIATLSGEIKILLSKGSCINDNTVGGVLTLKLNTVGNTQDNSLSFGTDQWIGHVYNWTGTSPPGGFPSSNSIPNGQPFLAANYVGYYNVPTETINEGFGGNQVCFPVHTNGQQLASIYTEQFAVRYRMKSTKTGCYLATFTGDDGIRVYVDGIKIFDEWKDQAPAGYGNVLLNLSGNSDIVFDFYENGGQNVANFSLTPFTLSSNTIIAPSITTVCNGTSPNQIIGSSYNYNGTVINPTIQYQWQISTDNVNFANISGATAKDYIPASITTTTGNKTNYYRRIVKAVASNANNCQIISNVVAIVTSQSIPNLPSTITGNAIQCPNTTNKQYSVAVDSNVLSYTWSVPNGWIVTSGANTNSIFVSTGNIGQNGSITVKASNGCGTSTTQTLSVSIPALSIGGNISANQTICPNTAPNNLVLSGNVGTIIKWQKDSSSSFSTAVDIANTSNTLLGTSIGNLSQTTYFRAVIQNYCGASVYSSTATISVSTQSAPTTQVGATYTFCIDNGNSYTTTAVNAGQYVKVNVIKGFAYTFSVGNVFAGLNENLTILEASTNQPVVPSVSSTGANGTTINWPASFSGQIKVILSKGGCVFDNSTGGSLVLTLNTIGNTQDSPTTFGVDKWVGHVYNWTGTAPPGGASPSTVSDTTPFSTANYVGYYAINTETIAETFGGSTNCFPVFSNGVVRTNIYTDKLAVRYRMKSTKTGCYMASFSGDDGIRIYVDGIKIFDEWKEQGVANYGNVLLYLNGNSEIVFDYYENSGSNVVNFSLSPFAIASNIIAQPTTNYVCNGVSPGVLNATSYVYNGAVVNPSIQFQWQISSDNITFTDIVGATTEDYTPAGITVSSGNSTKYYRRIVKANASNANSCTSISNVIFITTSQTIPAVPTTISGVTAQCAAVSGQIYSVAAITNAISYVWTVPTGWTINSGLGTASITVTTGNSGQNGNITVKAVNGCGSSANKTLAVTTVASTVSGIISGNQSICSGAQPNSLILTGNFGAILKWQKATDSNFISPTDIAITSSTLSGLTIGSLTQTTYFRAIVQNGSCTTLSSNIVTITVTPTAVGGIIDGTSAICSNTNSGMLTLTGSVGAIVRWESAVSPFTTWTPIANTSTSYTSGNLSETTKFRAVVQSGSCGLATSSVATITIEATTWNGIAWSNDTPATGKTVIFTSDFTINADVAACSILVTNNANIIVNSGFDVTLYGKITVDSGSSFTLNSDANLIQTTNVANSGNIIVKRISNPLMRLDYILWSTPVLGQQLQSFSPGTLANRFYNYDSSTDLYAPISAPATTNFSVGSGFLIRMSNWHPTTPTPWIGAFTGIPNNGDVTISVTNDTYNAIGNPYPSTIDADAFIAENNITEALYFWRKTNNYLTTSYATYTMAGGTGTAKNSVDPLALIPTGVIQVGQGFIARSTSTSFVFKNSMRLGNNLGQFFRNTTNEKNRVWLNLESDTGLFSQTLIAYMPNSSLGVDSALDGKYFNDSQIALTSLINTTEYAVQARGLFLNSDTVPLGFKTGVAGNYSITIDHTDGLLFADSLDVFIKDNLLNTIHNLSNGAYNFVSQAGVFNSRFEIVYQNTNTLSASEFENNTILVYKKDASVIINSGSEIMSYVTIFDVSGRLLTKTKVLNVSKTTIDTATFGNQVLLVQLSLNDGKKLTKKIIN
jgi:hypothetical protein